jgi:uncharacterized protein (TIGR00661 family)
LTPRLEEAGYRVELFASGRAFAALEELLPGRPRHRIRGLHFRYRDNRLDALRSGLEYLRIVGWWPRAKWQAWMMLWKRRPLAVITDYEPIFARTARELRAPHIAFDHQQVATECAVPARTEWRWSLMAMRYFNRMIDASPQLRVITSFFHPEFRPRSRGGRRVLVGPTLREEVLARQPTQGDHIVVYQTADTARWLEGVLPLLPGEKRVYGASIAPLDGSRPRPHSREGFLDDLASCRFAVVNGGHMGISEALHYGKPIVCLPIRGQVEQEINADWVERLGFGLSFRPEPKERPDFAPFLAREAEFRQNIAERRVPPGNQEALEAILGFLREAEETRKKRQK